MIRENIRRTAAGDMDFSSVCGGEGGTRDPSRISVAYPGVREGMIGGGGFFLSSASERVPPLRPAPGLGRGTKARNASIILLTKDTLIVIFA